MQVPNLVLHGHVDMEDQPARHAWTRAPVWCVWMQVQNRLLHEMWEAAEAAVPTRVMNGHVVDYEWNEQYADESNIDSKS